MVAGGAPGQAESQDSPLFTWEWQQVLNPHPPWPHPPAWPCPAQAITSPPILLLGPGWWKIRALRSGLEAGTPRRGSYTGSLLTGSHSGTKEDWPPPMHLPGASGLGTTTSRPHHAHQVTGQVSQHSPHTYDHAEWLPVAQDTGAFPGTLAGTLGKEGLPGLQRVAGAWSWAAELSFTPRPL